MSHFEDLIQTADAVVLDEFAVPVRWVRTSGASSDFRAIIDLEVELYGPSGELSYLSKAVTVRSSDMPSYEHGETIRELDKYGVPTGKDYSLQKTLSDDGSLKTIEIST